LPLNPADDFIKPEVNFEAFDLEIFKNHFFFSILKGSLKNALQMLGSLQNLEGLGGPFRGILDSLALATSEWRTWFQTDAPQVRI
jgi:hypothetical protein